MAHNKKWQMLLGVANNWYGIHDNAAIRQLLVDTYQEDFRNRFSLHALPQVDTAVFVSTPFAGTDYANRWLPSLPAVSYACL